MKLFLLSVLSVIYIANSLGQAECGTDNIHQYLLENDDSYKAAFESPSIHRSGFADTGQTIVIPIVVHVVHLGENVGVGSNISSGQIVGAINKMNQNFRASNGINIGIQFCLAKVDPSGQPTNGITRTNGRVIPGYASEGIGSSSSPTGLDIIEVKNLIQWPTDKYYNIHVVHKVQNASAFAYYPQPEPFFRDGTTIDAFYMNNFFSTLTHELGHAFNLRHTFNGDENGSICPANNDCETDGDFICDTDPHKRSDCIGGSSCGSSNSPNWNNTWQNYMSYCAITNRFTPLQKTRMRNAAFDFNCRVVLAENETVCTPFPQIDGAIVSIDYPIDGTINPICGNIVTPTFTLKNEGINNINQFSIDFTLDEVNDSEFFTTNLAFGESATFALPPQVINQNQAVNELEISITNINEVTDENESNNSKNISFGVNDTCLTTNLSDFISNQITIYPNPNYNGFINVKNKTNLNFTVELVNASGRKILSQKLNNTDEKINVNSIAKGVYFLIFKNETELIAKKILRL